jgi:hypothetical protein
MNCLPTVFTSEREGGAVPKKPSSRSRKRSSLATSSTVSVGGRRTYADQFIVVVTVYALKHGVTEAEAYFDVPARTITRWVNETKKMNDATIRQALSRTSNPYRETVYNLQRRMRLSDKLFAELEMSVEAERIKNDGYIPAHILSKLTGSFSTLVDKRRLEEGAHTALVQEAKEPEAIYAEGEARILEFRRRYGLPEGEATEEGKERTAVAALPDRTRGPKEARKRS